MPAASFGALLQDHVARTALADALVMATESRPPFLERVAHISIVEATSMERFCRRLSDRSGRCSPATTLVREG
ncbi:hypothetical protein GCM10027610_099740 [Dactylosporangium cerinum]